MTWIALGYALMSVGTFLAYGFDKHRAVHGGRRVPERTLHGLELLGGWPGGLAGQVLLRHKCRKLSYRLVFVAIVAIHGALWMGWYRWGQ